MRTLKGSARKSVSAMSTRVLSPLDSVRCGEAAFTFSWFWTNLGLAGAVGSFASIPRSVAGGASIIAVSVVLSRFPLDVSDS